MANYFGPQKLGNISQNQHFRRIDPYQNFQIWSYSDPFHQTFHFFLIFESPNVPTFENFLKKITIVWKNQAPGPIANERSQNSASDALIKSSGNLNPTDLVTKYRQKLEFLFFSNSFSSFILSGWLPGNLGPFSNERSQNSASDPLIDSSLRPNLTHFMSVQSSKMHVVFSYFLSF